MNPDAAFRACDGEARNTVRALLSPMRHATLAVLDPATGYPHLSRILCQLDADGALVALLSGIAAHSRALAIDPRAGLLIDAPPSRGDPMTQARLSLQVMAAPLPSTPSLRAHWIDRHPRSKLFLGLADFAFWRLTVLRGMLNAGFGAAFLLGPDDLLAPATIMPPPQ